MKKIIICLYVLIITFPLFSQQFNTIVSIDSFFAGVPVLKGYDKWVEYINTTSGLGIDSVKGGRVFSSLKKTKRNHFPFPDSIAVKFLTHNSETKITKPGADFFSVESVLIEGVFGDSKTSKKAAKASFEELKKMLSPYYKNRYKEAMSKDEGYFFNNGINDNFPTISIYWGKYIPHQHGIEYTDFPTLSFYYVILSYEHFY
jgi:hypothetical protein